MEEKISRRSALKRLGMMVAGTAAIGLPTAATLSSVTSCSGASRKRIIFYFTGTGNCLYVARELADENTELLSIPQMVRQDRYEFEADEIGLVYPVYGHMPPNMVRRFFQKATIRADYTFAVLTYGNRKCNAVELCDQFSRKAGHAFDYITTMIMVDNWLPNFDMNEQMKIDKHIPESLERIKADLSVQRHWLEPFTDEERQMHEMFMQYAGLDPEVGFLLQSEDYFTVTEACIDCGVCTEVCPRGNYSLTSRGIKVGGECEFCFACIQNCPQKAIQFVRKEGTLLANGEVNPNARYRNEHVSLWSIKEANRQNFSSHSNG